MVEFGSGDNPINDVFEGKSQKRCGEAEQNLVALWHCDPVALLLSACELNIHVTSDVNEGAIGVVVAAARHLEVCLGTELPKLGVLRRGRLRRLRVPAQDCPLQLPRGRELRCLHAFGDDVISECCNSSSRRRRSAVVVMIWPGAEPTVAHIGR